MLRFTTFTTFTILYLLFTSTSIAQELGVFKPLRYQDDYSFLKNDTIQDWYKSLKYKRLSADGENFMSMGGEARFRYLHLKNEQWGDRPADKDGYTLSRFLFHSDFHFGKHFRTFIQLQASLKNGSENLNPVENNPLDLHQAFVDIVPVNNSKEQLTLRIGRQELAYGGLRLVATRDNPNSRHSFDAGRIIYNRPQEKIRSELFYSHYVVQKLGIFDDQHSRVNKFWGSYHTKEDIFSKHNLDLYYFGIWRKHAVFNDAEGEELRHTVGTRIWKAKAAWIYDIEAFYQFGEVENNTVAAWTASLHTSYTFEDVRFKPQLGFKTEIISGDKAKGDGRLQTLNPLYPNGSYFGLAALVGPSNIIDCHPSAKFYVSKTFNVEVDYDLFWRYRISDGIYRSNSTVLYGDGDTSDRKIGNQFTASLQYEPNGFFYMRAELTSFQAGDYLKKVSAGKDILFLGITTQFKF